MSLSSVSTSVFFPQLDLERRVTKVIAGLKLNQVIIGIVGLFYTFNPEITHFK